MRRARSVAVLALLVGGACSHGTHKTTAPPVTRPPGWEVVRYGLASFAVPGTWPVEHDDVETWTCLTARTGVFLAPARLGGASCGLTDERALAEAFVVHVSGETSRRGSRMTVNGFIGWRTDNTTTESASNGHGLAGFTSWSVSFPALRLTLAFDGLAVKDADQILATLQRT